MAKRFLTNCQNLISLLPCISRQKDMYFEFMKTIEEIANKIWPKLQFDHNLIQCSVCSQFCLDEEIDDHVKKHY